MQPPATLHACWVTGMVTVLLTQVELKSPDPTPLMREFWTYAA